MGGFSRLERYIGFQNRDGNAKSGNPNPRNTRAQSGPRNASPQSRRTQNTAQGRRTNPLPESAQNTRPRVGNGNHQHGHRLYRKDWRHIRQKRRYTHRRYKRFGNNNAGHRETCTGQSPVMGSMAVVPVRRHNGSRKRREYHKADNGINQLAMRNEQ